MKNRVSFVKVMLGLILLGTVTSGSPALAGKPKPPSGCPKAIMCADVWIPVVCANGVTYSNQCYADRACAPGPCTPADGGPVVVE